VSDDATEAPTMDVPDFAQVTDVLVEDILNAGCQLSQPERVELEGRVTAAFEAYAAAIPTTSDLAPFEEYLGVLRERLRDEASREYATRVGGQGLVPPRMNPVDIEVETLFIRICPFWPVC
jgi:hypothetical protein